MRKGISTILTILLITCGTIATAQMQGGSGQHMMGGQGMMSGQHMMGPGMMRNMDMMSGMMSDMNHMISRGHMTPDQQRQMFELMHRMGGIMQEMGGPKGGGMMGQHYKQLQEMRKQLDEMKKHVK
ncbi:MAG TPA: hypothetical protein VFG19_02810 [Geobacteraceae bacterium]|nr:hypothetical protein [Geobacteraceae bacterium]